MTYEEFLMSKQSTIKATGFDVNTQELNKLMFDYQKAVAKWCLKKGKSAVWSGCGTGKTLIELEYGQQIYKKEKENILLVAPLAVAQQTAYQESKKFAYDVNYCRKQSEIKSGLNITNYEMIENFNPDKFGAVIIDESSILKSYNGKYRTLFIDMFQNTPYKLSATATPSPNDYMELGNHSEFTGVMTRTEMLSTFFVHDGGDTGKWRLKGHAEDKFWEWISNWAVVFDGPADLGFPSDGFELPELRIHEIMVEAERDEFYLIPKVANTLQERRQARKDSLEKRVKKAAEIANNLDEQVIIWCDMNDESKMLAKLINGSVEVKGPDKPEHKINTAMDFANGKIKAIVSKPSIFGWGMNWQNSCKSIFTGLSDSYEQWYQAVRRQWRYGQKKPVDVYIVISEEEGAVKANIERKERDAENMKQEMIKHNRKILATEINETQRESIQYFPIEEMILPKWLRRTA